MYKNFVVDRNDKIVVVTLNRPEKRNPINEEMLSEFENLEQISIAAINGYAIGGGWGLALACDFRMAVPGAQFWFPEVDLGVPLGIGSTSRVVSMVGAARAKEIIITGGRYTAEDLHAWGMINRIVAPEMLMETAHDFAIRLTAKNPRAVAGSKLSINAIAAVAAREVTTVQPELFIHT